MKKEKGKKSSNNSNNQFALATLWVGKKENTLENEKNTCSTITGLFSKFGFRRRMQEKSSNICSLLKTHTRPQRSKSSRQV